MENKKLRRILAIVALAFMAVFTVTFVITLYDPKLCHGAFSYAALVSGLLGIGLFLVVRFLLKEKKAPDYLPDRPTNDNDENDGEANGESAETQASDTRTDESDGSEN